MFIIFKLKTIVNHRTYLRRPTSKGTIACTKRLSEITSIARAEITILKDRLTNLNPKVGSEVPHPNKDVRGVRYYVVYPILSQSKQPTRSTSKNGENPKSIINCQKRAEFGISRRVKALGRRRIHSTTVICRKGSSRFTIGGAEFEGSTIKDQFDKLKSDLKNNNKVNNLTAILSNKKFLIGCYQNIKPKSGNITQILNEEALDVINSDWFEKISNSFKNGLYKFKPSRKTYISKSNGKLRPLIMPSSQDKIIQEGMRILLDAVFEGDFQKSSHAFQAGKGHYSALNQIRMKFGKVNWFIEGDIEQQYSGINHNVLVDLLREKIQDEPFIDLIYKYLKLRYGEKYDVHITPMRIGLSQGGLISSSLFNIYMHSFDVWVEDILIPKYTKGKRYKSNPKNTKVIRTFESAVDKSIRTSSITDDFNYVRVYYVRYVDNFLMGVHGSKKTCDLIKREIKSFLEEKLLLTLNPDKTKITHSITEEALFLGYHISCIPIKKMQIGHSSKKRFVRKTTRTILTAPLKRVLKRLKEKGFLNQKDMPTRNGRYINTDLWNIIDNYRTIERGILNYYSLANNYGRFAARVHYSLKYSCALTVSSKMKLKTTRGAFKKYGKNLTIEVDGKSISYPKISYKRPRKKVKFVESNFDKALDRLMYRLKWHVGNS